MLQGQGQIEPVDLEQHNQSLVQLQSQLSVWEDQPSSSRKNSHNKTLL